MADNLHWIARKHLHRDSGKDWEHFDLYRIFYYDCEPLSMDTRHPITKRNINFGRTDEALWRRDFLEELRKKRKTALRLGELSPTRSWTLKPHAVKNFFKGKLTLANTTEEDVKLDIKQKGVDMRIGLDIASLSYKKMVEKIILISGDSDFVPAAKLARREGIDFVLNPLWADINPELFEHIDGMESITPRSSRTPQKDGFTSPTESGEKCCVEDEELKNL